MKSNAHRHALSNGRAFVLCLSFANLCFLTAWAELQDRDGDFFRTSTATWTQLAAVTLDVLILAVILWVPAVLALRSGKPLWVRVLKWATLVSLMIPINTIRRDPFIIRSGEMLRTKGWHFALGLVGVAVAVILLAYWERLSPRVTSAILTVLLPAIPLAMAASAWRIYSGPSGPLPNKPLLPALQQKPGGPHVLWIIFDEWDQALTFDARGPNLLLPELDRLRDQSFYAGRAYPPARHTIISVPSLLSGKTFSKSTPHGASELLETYDLSGPPENLSAEATIFSEARSAGFNIGIVGFYLPYCRLFGEFTTCAVKESDDGLSLAGLMLATAKDQLSRLPFALQMGIASRIEKERSIQNIQNYNHHHRDMLQAVNDPRLNLVFVHLNLPHGPPIYDAAKESFSVGKDATYLGNIALVDRTLRDLRQALENAGVWDHSTILLSSDHPLRVHKWRTWLPPSSLPTNVQQGTRVPFLLKMAGQKQGVAYPRAIQTVVTKDLLLAILAQKVTTAEQVGVWLDTHPPRQ